MNTSTLQCLLLAVTGYLSEGSLENGGMWDHLEEECGIIQRKNE